MIPKYPFVMENPIQLSEEAPHFYLFASQPLIDYVRELPCVIYVEAWAYPGQWRVTIDPRYDTEEAWLSIYYELESQCESPIPLDSVWGIDEASDSDKPMSRDGG